MRKCNFCGAENSEDAEVCENCDEELDDQNSEVKRGLVFGSRRVLVVFSLVVIIIVGSYFAYYFLSNTSVEVEDPQIFLERVEINEIERDWLENSTWQVSATAYFKILNFNDFDLQITQIDFSVYVIEDGKSIRISDGSSSGGLIPPNSSLQLNETFWFLAGDEGVKNLETDSFQFGVQGIALFLVETSSATQDGAVQFSDEV